MPKSTVLLDMLEESMRKEIPIFYFLHIWQVETQRSCALAHRHSKMFVTEPRPEGFSVV